MAKPDEEKGYGDDGEGLSWGYNFKWWGMETRHEFIGEQIPTQF